MQAVSRRETEVRNWKTKQIIGRFLLYLKDFVLVTYASYLDEKNSEI